MKWIYFRADTVVIWLGKKYSRYQLWTKAQTGQGIVPQGIEQEGPQALGTVPETTAESGEVFRQPYSPQAPARPPRSIMQRAKR